MPDSGSTPGGVTFHLPKPTSMIRPVSIPP